MNKIRISDKKKGSILVWTMFVSIFAVAIFVSYQSIFENYLKSSVSSEGVIIKKISWDDAIKELSWNPTKILSLSWGTNLRSLDFNWSSFFEELKYNESIKFLVTNSWGETTLTWAAYSWSSVSYSVMSFLSWSNSNIIEYDSWTINWGYSKIIKIWFDSTHDTNMIYFKSLAWKSKILLKKWNTNAMPENSMYEEYKTFAWFIIPERHLTIINFDWNKFKTVNDSVWIYINSSNYEQ